MIKMKVTAYVCSGCGCIHLDPAEIFQINEQEFCSDCIDFVDVELSNTYGKIVLKNN